MLKIALLILVFLISPSIGLALTDSIDDNQKRFITIYTGDAPSAVSSEVMGAVYELFTDAEPYMVQAEPELDPTIVQSRYVRVNLDYLKESESIVLNLFNDISVTAVRDRIEKRSESRYTWFGQVSGRGYSSVILTVEDGDMAGHILIDGKQYHVRPLGNEIHAVRELDPCAFPSDNPDDVVPPDVYPDTSTVLGAQYNAAQGLQHDDGSIIDVMVVYTDDVASASGNIGAEIQLAIDQANQTYENSFINQRLRLVHTAEVNYSESDDAETNLICIQKTDDSCLDEVHDWRDEYRADIVSLWVERGMNCSFLGCWVSETRGLSYLTFWGHQEGPPTQDNPHLAFNVVRRKWASDDYVFAHELGHNMGAGHDIHAPSESGNEGAFPYSYGYTWDGWTAFPFHYALRSIMAYRNWCDDNVVLSCPRIGVWSNPNIYFEICEWPFDWPCTGSKPFGYVDAVDNHRALNETAYIVANYRQSNLPPVCDANGPYVAECGGATTEITLDGTGSSDPDPGDVLTYSWSTDCPGGFFDDPTSATPKLTVDTSPGCSVNCSVTLTVTDSAGLSDNDTTSVTISDTLPPTTICPADITIECDQPTDPGNTGSATATDGCDPNPVITFLDAVTPGACPEERTILRTWNATDYCGNSSSCTQIINVVDTTPSAISCNAPATIRPPDAPVSFIATAIDNCDDQPDVTITSYDCYKFTKKGERIDKKSSCVVEVAGQTITILDSGGVDDIISWNVSTSDNCGNTATKQCTVKVVNPAK